MENKITKVALYCRVSSTEQDTLNQEFRLVDYVKVKGWQYDLYKETESTRKTRPVKQELLQRLRKSEYDAIVVYKLDRYARSSSELILEVKELVDKGIAFISISDNLDFSTASGKLHFQILCAFAEFERELIRERTIEGLRRTKIQGTKLGRPKGAKDSKPRPKAGYLIRQAIKKKEADNKKGINTDLKNYL
jgi:DNA invertase Pin-like site-specific DNA recombinase